jgi:2-dehydropantoate 2-reductase
VDMKAGKPLEVDELLGAVVRMARDMGIPIPASSALVMALEPFKNGSEAGN